MNDSERDELLVRLEENVKALTKTMEQVTHVLLEGNGKPPMTIRLALAEQELERLKEERADKKMPRSAWVGIVVSAVLGIIGIGISLA